MGDGWMIRGTDVEKKGENSCSEWDASAPSPGILGSKIPLSSLPHAAALELAHKWDPPLGARCPQNPNTHTHTTPVVLLSLKAPRVLPSLCRQRAGSSCSHGPLALLVPIPAQRCLLGFVALLLPT